MRRVFCNGGTMTIAFRIFGRRARMSALLLSSALYWSACADTKVDPPPEEPNGELDPEIADCDPIDPSECSLPWPSNLYLVADDSTDTGARLQFGDTSLPKGKKQIRPRAWSILDGYGVSTPILFKAPNLDLSDLPSETDPQASWDGAVGKAQIFKVEDDESLTRVPFWAEQDLREDPATSLYYLRPARILDEGGRYIVMLRDLKDTSGKVFERSPAFDALVRGDTAKDPYLKDRQARFDWVFERLESVGIERDELFLAWDFNVASHTALHGPMMQARELILDALDGGGPDMMITEIKEYQRDDPAGDEYNPYIRYALRGKFSAPQIVKKQNIGYLLNFNDNGDIELQDAVEREFWVRIPYRAVGADAEPAYLMQYGHGLMNAGDEISSQSQERMAEIHNYIYFASNWTGMSIPDFGAVYAALQDFSNFRYVSDNMHQGVLEFMILAKGMKHTFFDLEELQTLEPIQAQPDNIVYSGNSQGGIYGPTYLAISPDVQFGQMGVPGSNYNMLLQRSTAFDMYAGIALPMLQRDYTKLGIALAAAQSLWDMVDSSSWFLHLNKEPLYGEEKFALLHPARGDYQVSPLTNLILANSDLDLHVMRGWGQDITKWGLQETDYGTEEAPFRGSAIVIYNAEQEWPAPGNFPPEDLDADPHGWTRYFHELQIQADHFLRNHGEVLDVCDGGECNFVRMSAEDCDALLAAEPGPNTRSTQCWELSQ